MRKEKLNKIETNVGTGPVSARENHNKLQNNKSNTIQNRVGVACYATQKAITLISLIITIIILLILAGVTINLTLGENGIFGLAQNAGKNYMDAQEQEKNIIANYENKIGEYVDGTRETVTISKEEYESLIPSPIADNSLLMSSSNTSKALGNLNLTSFTNNFSKSCENYFSYDSTTGELICKKAGWYIVKLEISLDNQNGAATLTRVSLFINNIDIGNVQAKCRSGSVLQSDCNTITFYVRQGEKLNFIKKTEGGEAYYLNTATISLYKM